MVTMTVGTYWMVVIGCLVIGLVLGYVNGRY